MKKNVRLAIASALFLCLNPLFASVTLLEKRNTPVPDFGVILNEDGDFGILDPNPQKAEQLLRAHVNGQANLGVNTYVYSVGAGSDVLYYQTKVASEMGWRVTDYEQKAEDGWGPRMVYARGAISQGFDAIRIAGSQAKAIICVSFRRYG